MLLRKINPLVLLLSPFLFVSCLKETNDNLDQIEKFYLNNPDAIAQVKFIHAYTPLTLGGTPAQSTATTGFRITRDGVKVNGATNTSSSTNTLIYGGVFPPTTAYSFQPPGLKNFRFTMNRITAGAFAPVTGDEIFNTTTSLAGGKKYSMFIADPYNAPGVYLTEDNFQEPNRDGYALRFINLCGDLTTRFDLTSARHGMIFSNVANKELRNFRYLTATGVSDTLYLRLNGTNTVVSQVNTFIPGTQRVYTFYARGKTGVTGRTPNLTFYTNR